MVKPEREMRKSLFILTVFLLSHLACGPTNGVKLVGFPVGIIGQNSPVTMRFSRALVPTDSLNLWSDIPYVDFMPSIPGKFIWQDTATLMFSPDGRLPGDIQVIAKLNTELLLRQSGAPRFIGSEEFTFRTESFRMSKAEFFYDRLDDKKTVGVKANFEFTYVVNPNDLVKYIKIQIDGKDYKGTRAATAQLGKSIPIEIGVIPQMEKAQEISVSFDKSFVSPETNTGIKMEKPFTYRLPGIGKLVIHGHDVGYDGNKGWIKINTSQEVDLRTVKSFVALDPALNYTVESSEQRGFILRGDFQPGAILQMTIKKGLESVLGAKIENDYVTEVVIGNVSPSFQFASEAGKYMLLTGGQAIDVKSINVRNLIVTVSQVFQNNLLFFLNHGSRYSYDYGYDEDGNYTYSSKYRYSVTDEVGRKLVRRNIPVATISNKEVTTAVDMKPYLNNGFKGFYVVQVADSVKEWNSDSKLVIISNIGLIVKKSDRDLMVFAVSLETNKPLVGTTINVISANNQTLASLMTDGQGAARFADYEQFSKDFTIKLITAELEDDFNFIDLDANRVEKSRFEVDGVRDLEHRYEIFMYGDRNLYRPGEKIHITGILRSSTANQATNMPVRIQINNPRGNRIAEIGRTLNDEGAFEAEYQTSTDDLTGTYTIQLYTGDSKYLSSYDVKVEDFVPDRLRVHLNASKPSAKTGDTISYRVEALNFFGPPAAGRSWEFEGLLKAIPFRSKKFPEFTFRDDAVKVKDFTPTVIKGQTDENGKSNCEWVVPGDAVSSGLLEGVGRVGVFDESGRPVYQAVTTRIHPKDYYIGIKNRNPYYISPKITQTVEIVAVNTEDEPIRSFRAMVKLVRYEWHSVLRMHGNTKSLRYVSEKKEVEVRAEELTLGGAPVTFTFTLPGSGEYALRVSKTGDDGYNSISSYAYSWGSTDVTSFKVDPEARIDMVFDKQVYSPGDRAKVLFQAPFDGTMLVTVERNKVLSYQYLEVQDKAASLDIYLDDQSVPNVYVAAVLFRKIKELTIPLLVGHGFAPLMVENPGNRLRVSIEAPEKIRPKTKQTITVDVGNEKNVYVTLAAVDEGICQITAYRSPNPYGYFYAKKALGVETYDFFKDLIAEPEKRSSTGGGGEDEDAVKDLKKRASSIGVMRFKPVALWSGIVKADRQGKADIELDVPNFNGELRLMAVAYKGKQYGWAQRAMKVADPVVLTAALPRFMSPNDRIIMPITAFNTTATPVSLTFDIETSGGITTISPIASLEVGANQERFINVSLQSTNEIGKAVVNVRTKAFGETIESVTELPVRPISPFVTESFTGVVEGGKTVTQSIDDGFLSFGRRAYVSLSPYPVGNFSKQLKNLVGYPHGCLEQTTSKAFPQIYLRDIASVLDPSILSKGSPAYFVNEAINKISSMQLSNGQFSYWPGGDNSAYDWATVYATHFLVEAQKAGYNVQEGVLHKALSALVQIARTKKTYDYGYYVGQSVGTRRIADKSGIYALYVLALAGRSELTLMNYYRTERSLLTTDMKYLLAGAFAHSGDRKTFVELLPPQFETEEAARTSGDYFDSPIRANGLILNVLLDVSPNDPNVPRYADYLSKAYERYSWYSTQDQAFTLLALGKMARIASKTSMTGTVGVGAESFDYKGGTQKIDVLPFGKTVSLNMKGEGRLYYSIVTEGIRTDGKVRIEDKNLRIRRTLLDRFGNEINLNSIKQNDLVVVRLVLNTDVTKLENVAISDLLPAGFEIENPRLTRGAYDFIREANEPEYLDIRDDRINLYTSFRFDRQQTFFYLVRAVSQGEFNYAPVVAEAMYDGNYYSASGGPTKIRIAK